MHVQVVALRAVQSVLRQETGFFAPTHPLLYVLAKCPCAGPSYLYGTLPWNLAHRTRDFREAHLAGRIKK
jgi:hypothetical protein